MALHKSGRLNVISKASFLLAGLYALWVVYSVTRHATRSPATKPQTAVRSSPHRKTLEKPHPFYKKVGYRNYKDALPEILAHPAPHYVLFVSGTVDGTPNGVYWCGDCFVASPIVRELVSKAGGALLEVDVGSEDEWHSETNPLRLDKEAPVKYIPTLYHWSKEGPGTSISSQLNADEEVPKLRVLVAQFLKETAGGVRSVLSVAQSVIEAKGAATNRA